MPDQPGHDWGAKPLRVKGVSSKPSNEKIISLEELSKNTNPEFDVPNQGSAPSF